MQIKLPHTHKPQFNYLTSRYFFLEYLSADTLLQIHNGKGKKSSGNEDSNAFGGVGVR